VIDDRQVPAGWYPDPLGLPQLRWWDGQGWAEHISEARRPLIDRQPRPVAFAEPDDQVRPGPLAAEVGNPVVPPTAAPVADAGPAALPAGASGEPAQGWSGAAVTIASMRRGGVPTILEVDVAGHPPLLIDLRHNAFAWQLGLDRFPAEPAAVSVSVRIADEASPAPFELPGAPLDSLLWHMGFAAFPDRLAPWLSEGEAYAMPRWPQLTGFEPDTDPLRQAAALSNGVFTIAQLAGFTGRSLEATRTLINALSLMGALDVVSR